MVKSAGTGFTGQWVELVCDKGLLFISFSSSGQKSEEGRFLGSFFGGKR